MNTEYIMRELKKRDEQNYERYIELKKRAEIQEAKLADLQPYAGTACSLSTYMLIFI